MTRLLCLETLMRFKICCIQSVEEAEMAIASGAWAIGLVAAMPSGPGPVDDTRIRTIADATKDRVRRVLLTSQTAPKDVVDHILRCGTDVVQLVDAVPVQTCAAIRKHCPDVQIIQVVHVGGEDALEIAKAAAPHGDMILLDSGRPDGPVKQLGGTGRTHNWDISRKVVEALDGPVILAGGLNSDNAKDACVAVKPFALDICSGLRRSGFALDAEKLSGFAQVCDSDFTA
jgi:phosphoribosylanthranilate isomerase